MGGDWGLDTIIGRAPLETVKWGEGGGIRQKKCLVRDPWVLSSVFLPWGWKGSLCGRYWGQPPKWSLAVRLLAENTQGVLGGLGVLRVLGALGVLGVIGILGVHEGY